MKRKLIKQGLSAYTITLPVSWIRENNLSSGSELDISHEEGNLKISTDSKKAIKSIELNINDFQNSSRLRSLISSAYRRGFDKIIIRSKSPLSLIDISFTVESLTGLVIQSQTPNKIEIVSVLNSTKEDLDIATNQFFNSVKFLISEVTSNLNQSNSKNKKEELSNIKKGLLTKRDYCLRIIQKNSTPNSSYFEYYSAILILEKIASLFFNIFSKKMVKTDYELLTKMENAISELITSFKKQDLNSLIQLNEKLSKIKKQSFDQRLIPELYVILNYVFDLSSRLLSIYC